MNNESGSQSPIALEQKKEQSPDRRSATPSFNETLDVLLAIAEALVQDTPDEESTQESSTGRRLTELAQRILGCQYVGLAVLDAQNDQLQSLAIACSKTEHEQKWRESINGVRLQSLVGTEEQALSLRAGEIIPLHTIYTLFGSHTSFLVIAPIHMSGHLLGILLFDYGQRQPHPWSDEQMLISAISRFAALVIERGKAQHEHEQALSALREANEQLEYMNKIKSDFVSVVSHEFRSALTTIQGFSEMMYEEDLSVSEMKEFAVDIQQDAKRLSRMISDMLDLERMEAGSIRLNCNWLDLNAVIMEAANHMRQIAPHHTIRLRLANALPVLMGDVDKLTQVVENLLSNAIKYSADGSEIFVNSCVEGGAVHVYVQDQGIGIPPEAIDRIFERYERIETGTRHTVTGTGLGLSIVRQIVQMHGGQVWAESVVGEGSLFHFTVQFTTNPVNLNGLLT